MRALWKSCDRGLTVLCQLNMKLRRKASLGQNEKNPFGLLFAASQQDFWHLGVVISAFINVFRGNNWWESLDTFTHLLCLFILISRHIILVLPRCQSH